MQSTTTPHLGDGEILHLVDRDASAWELDVWSKHVLACEQCAARLAERRRTAAAVSAALGVLRLPDGFPTAAETMRAARGRPRATPLARMASRPALRAAAVVLVLLLPVVLVSPVRAAVVDWLRQGWGQLAGALGAGETTPITTPGSPATPAPTYAVSFTPAGEELSIALAERQRGGSLAIAATGGSEASLEVRGGGEESPLVSDAGVRILNAPESTAVYEIAVPATVRTVVVRIGDEPALTLTRAEVAAGWRRDFATPSP